MTRDQAAVYRLLLWAVKREEVDLLLTGMRLKRPASSP